MTLYVINPNSTQAVTDGIDRAIRPLRAWGYPIECLTLAEGPAAFAFDAIEEPPPADLAARAAELIGPAPVDVDALGRDLRVPAAHLAEALMELELAGVAERRAGGLVARIV